MQRRQPNLEGIEKLPRRLVKALRMRPDRIIVGEVARPRRWLVAMNAGLACVLRPCHLAHDALAKICTPPLLAGENISREFVT